jgi:hypothetical protein
LGRQQFPATSQEVHPLAETLSPKTVRDIHNVVHVALKRAVKTKLIPFNPTDNCDLPRVDQKEAVALNAEQLASYQQLATGTWQRPPGTLVHRFMAR